MLSTTIRARYKSWNPSLLKVRSETRMTLIQDRLHKKRHLGEKARPGSIEREEGSIREEDPAGTKSSLY